MNILCAGAAQGVIKAIEAEFLKTTGERVNARFGSVGVLKEAVLAGEPCDVLIVTAAMTAALQRESRLMIGSEAPVGRVRVGIAVPQGAPLPDISTPDALKARLLAAGAIYFPETQRATAGIHFATVLAKLGIAEEVSGRLYTFPSGGMVMRELGASTEPDAIGCTQITEINFTPSVVLVGPLPPAFELATVYTASVSVTASNPALAHRFVEWVTGPESRALREQGGFEFT
jgi:molybdate transport system substrate-binding protein